MVGNADNIAGIGLLGDLPLTGEEKLRRVQGNRLAGANLLQLHAADQPARAYPCKGDTIPMVGIHIGLDLEYQRRQSRLGRLHHPPVGRLVAGPRPVFGQSVQQIGNADLADRAAEIDRRQMPGSEGFGVEFRQSGSCEIDLLGHRNHARIRRIQLPAQMQLLRPKIESAGKLAGPADRPGNRRGIQSEGVGNLLQQFERIARLAVHFVDEGDDRYVAQTTDLE